MSTAGHVCEGGTEPAFELGAGSHPWAEAQDKRSILSILGAPLLFLLRTKSFSISRARELELCKLVMRVPKGRRSRKTPRLLLLQTVTKPSLSSKLHELTVILSGIKRLEQIGTTFISPNEDSYISVASP